MSTSSAVLERIACPKLNDLARRLRAWRATRQPGQRIPMGLWSAATKLARQHGVSSIAVALHLGYADLQRRAQGRAGKASRAAAPAAFGQLPPTAPLPPAAGDSHLEWIQPSGARLLVRLDHPTARELVPLLQTLLRHRL